MRINVILPTLLAFMTRILFLLPLLICLGMKPKLDYIARPTRALFCVKADSVILKDSVSLRQFNQKNTIKLILCSAPSDTLPVKIVEYIAIITNKKIGILELHIWGNKFEEVLRTVGPGDSLLITSIIARSNNKASTYKSETWCLITK